MKFCKHCGSQNLATSWQTFKDNSRHNRVDCGDCGQFNGYLKQNNGFDSLIEKDFQVETMADAEALARKVYHALRGKNSIKGHKVSVFLKAR